jgi:hypothetical protein
MQDALPHDAAQCPAHPGISARAVCARCGNFVCDLCTEQGRHAECLACRERRGPGFRFSRDAWTISGLASYSWATFKRDWVPLVLGVFILGVVSMLLGAAQGAVQIAVLGIQASQTPFAMKTMLLSSGFGLVLSLLVTPMLIGYIELCLMALRGRPVALGTMFAPYARFVTVATLVVGFALIGFVYNLTLSFFFADQTLAQVLAKAWLWGLLASPLLLFIGIGFGFAYAVLADDPNAGALEALTRSWRIAAGQRWSILLVWIISGLAMTFGLLMCLLPALVAVPWVSLLWSASYLALATPTVARGPAP